MNLILVKLEEKYRSALTEMMDEWTAAESDITPMAIARLDYRDFAGYLENLDKVDTTKYVPQSTFFCLDTDSGKFVGAVNIRHCLNDRLRADGGHIGDGVRPSMRGRGIGTKMVALALEKCRELGLGRVLMVCDAENKASETTIVKNGGVLENELEVNGNRVKRFWIELDRTKLRLTALKYGETTLPESWVFEGGDKSVIIPISLLFFLIEENGRKILVDVGCDTMPGFERPICESPVATLRRIGIEPEEIDEVLLSHSHHDHIDGLRYFRRATVRINERELASAMGYLPKNHDGSPAERVKPFGDECRVSDSIVIRHIGGHSPGSSAVIVRSGELEYILTGDEFYSPRCVGENRPSGIAHSREAGLEFLEYCRGAGRICVIAHDYAHLPGQLGAAGIL